MALNDACQSRHCEGYNGLTYHNGRKLAMRDKYEPSSHCRRSSELTASLTIYCAFCFATNVHRRAALVTNASAPESTSTTIRVYIMTCRFTWEIMEAWIFWTRKRTRTGATRYTSMGRHRSRSSGEVEHVHRQMPCVASVSANVAMTHDWTCPSKMRAVLEAMDMACDAPPADTARVGQLLEGSRTREKGRRITQRSHGQEGRHQRDGVVLVPMHEAPEDLEKYFKGVPRVYIGMGAR